MSNYKTNSRILGLNCETKLVRYVNPCLANGYCSITVVNYGLIRPIRFVSRISTHLSKKFHKQILFDTTK